MTDSEIKNLLELALLTSQAGPLSSRALARMFSDAEEVGEKRVRAALDDLSREWQNRALELRETAGGFQFISRDGGMDYLRRLSPRKPPRLSRPLTEILAFIAYRQPATRGDIERARGIAVSSQQIAALEGYGWIEEVGRRETPGRPVLYATTRTFLDDLGLAKLEDLPTPEAAESDADSESEEADFAPTGDGSGPSDAADEANESGRANGTNGGVGADSGGDFKQNQQKENGNE